MADKIKKFEGKDHIDVTLPCGKYPKLFTDQYTPGDSHKELVQLDGATRRKRVTVQTSPSVRKETEVFELERPLHILLPDGSELTLQSEGPDCISISAVKTEGRKFGLPTIVVTPMSGNVILVGSKREPLARRHTQKKDIFNG